MFTPWLIAAGVGYVLGSLPFGYLVARAKGVDIFTVGSKNPGATNVRRVLGSGPGNLVFALDALKGAIATGWPLLFFLGDVYPASGGEGGVPFGPNWPKGVAIVGLVGALFGHSYSCFTKFRGGKGVATGTGGMLVLMPLALVISAAVWVAIFYSFRYVSLASLLAAVVLPIAAWILREPNFLCWFAALVTVFVFIRHRTNIQRLLKGTEAKFVKSAKQS